MVFAARALGSRIRQIVAITRVAPFDTSTAEGRSLERLRRVAWTSIATVAAKAITLVTTLVSVPLTVHYLGTERYGMWMTISSIIAALSFADLGMGNGLVNAISVTSGRNDRLAAQRAVSSTFVILLAISLVILSLFAACYGWVAWHRVFNVSSGIAKAEAGPAVLVFVLCFAVNLPLGVVQRIQLGFQEGFASALWQSSGNVLGLIVVILVIRLRLGLPYLVLGMSGGPVLVAVLNGVVQFGWIRRWLTPSWKSVDWATGRVLVGAGVFFTILNLMAILGSHSDSLIIAHYQGAAAVSVYAVTQKLFWMTYVAQFFVVPLWPAFGEAMACGDYAWASRTLKQFGLLSVGTGVVGGLALICFGRQIITVWTGAALVPSMALLVSMAAWNVIGSYGGVMSAFLNNERTLRKQVWFYSAASIASLTLKFPLVILWHQAGVVWATVIAYTLLYVWPARALSRKALAQMESDGESLSTAGTIVSDCHVGSL